MTRKSLPATQLNALNFIFGCNAGFDVLSFERPDAVRIFNETGSDGKDEYRVINPLVKKGLIEYVESPQIYKNGYTITEKGLEMLESAYRGLDYSDFL